MNRRNIKETLELIVTAGIITYAVMQCNKQVGLYQEKNGMEYIKENGEGINYDTTTTKDMYGRKQ